LRERPRLYPTPACVPRSDRVASGPPTFLTRSARAALGPDSAAFRHIAAEAMAMAFVDNIAHYGDPDFVPAAPVDALASRAFSARRAAMIDPARALPRPVAALEPGSTPNGGPRRITSPPWPPRLAGTSQMAAADAEGNMASLTTSISAGSYVAVPETGIILNNGMNNFDPRPGRPNSIAPGKMPIFAVPTL